MIGWEPIKLFSNSVFFASVISYFFIFIFIRRKANNKSSVYPTITVIIPCHNEEGVIEEVLDAVLKAKYPSKVEVVVINDASQDQTAQILSKLTSVKVITNLTQCGKSASLNRGIEAASGELIAVVDGDSVISKSALKGMAERFYDESIGGCGAVVMVKNTNHFFCWWSNLELLYFSLIRLILTRVNANITTPGPLSVYRKSALTKIGGFNTMGFSEDADITIRLIHGGYKMEFCDEAIVKTVMPFRAVEIIKQRFRWPLSAS